MTHYHVYRILPLNPDMSQENSIHILTNCCLNICEKKNWSTKDRVLDFDIVIVVFVIIIIIIITITITIIIIIIIVTMYSYRMFMYDYTD
jgi:hypothetical protein